MKTHLYTPVYAITLLLSAALLFSVQPMFSKMILPLLGGTPQVWNTAMLFFQVALLAGYGYAHATTRFLGIRTQAILHMILLAAFTLVLPLGISNVELPPVDRDPTFWQLSAMLMTVGGPFFVLAASAPMLQRWFAHTDHPDAHNPYFLYGASNLGSMSALLLYPVAIEPLLTLSGQSYFWMVGYGLLIAMIALSALFVWKHAGPETGEGPAPDIAAHPVTWAQRRDWLILAFIPSSLMLGVTTFITTDIASAPLLWIVPLALYVGTFIIVFARKTYVSNMHLAFAQGTLMSVFVLLLISGVSEYKFFLIFLHLALFTSTAWMCHGILSARRPDKAHLTEFYLLMSLGGALGGFFNAIVAPQIFTSALEYPLILAAACFCRFWGETTQIPGAPAKTSGQGDKFSNNEILTMALAMIAIMAAYYSAYAIPVLTLLCAFTVFAILFLYIDRRWIFAIIAGLTLLVHRPEAWIEQQRVLHAERNFFGIIKIFDDVGGGQRVFLHGTTNHGTQALDEKYKLAPISYYSKFSPLYGVFEIMNDRPAGPQNMAVIGLGSGATSCFARKDRHFDFFEIDPAVIRIAENPDLFTYLSDCGSPYDIILGDGRMTMQRQPDHRYDMILLDVFSSDNIPAHVLTEEAVRIYLSKLKPDGIVVFHISNNFLDLEPVLAATAEKIGIPGYGGFTDGGVLEDSQIEYYGAHYFAMTHSKDLIAALKDKDWTPGITHKGIHSWNDQFSDIFSVLGRSTIMERVKAFHEKKEEEEKAKKDAGEETAPGASEESK